MVFERDCNGVSFSLLDGRKLRIIMTVSEDSTTGAAEIQKYLA
jgi:hypothetical protein